MADALLSPAVGTTLWAGSVAVGSYASRRLKSRIDDSLIPLMGVLGAFIFAAQMVNFTIPGTGSSGHLGGGMILAILLGPQAAFLVMASVLTVQALFFADGGLLALGCNVWNLGFYPCCLAYPLVYRPLAGAGRKPGRILLASLAAGVVSLQLGAFSVVLETLASGQSDLPFGAFALLMQPIHLAIGIVEGVVTAGVIVYVQGARPELIESIAVSRPLGQGISLRRIVAVFAALALIAGGGLSWLASTHPDGLEWSIAALTGKGELPEAKGGVAAAARTIQEKTAFMPDYAFPTPAGAVQGTGTAAGSENGKGTSAAGVIGGALVLGMVLLIGLAIRLARRKGSSP